MLPATLEGRCRTDVTGSRAARPMNAPDGTILLDARWLPKGGAGTFTRALVTGLGRIEPPGRWLLWGPAPLADLAWPGASHVPSPVDPAAWFGQRSTFRVPGAGLVVHPHQTRPVHRRPAASCVLDLIQLLHPSAPVRRAKALRLSLTIRAASALFVIAPAVGEQLIADFAVDPATITLLHLPVDADAASRVAARRAARSPDRALLAIGRFTPHKNFRRLVQAFDSTRFASAGGQLHLVGGSAAELDVGPAPLPAGVRVLGVLDQAGLEDALSRALALVQPSLIEGFGLPVAEALAAGVPVTSSPVPAVTDFGPPGVPVFDPSSVSSIADAIDETVALIDEGAYWRRVDRGPWLSSQPTPATLAQELIGGLRRTGLI